MLAGRQGTGVSFLKMNFRCMSMQVYVGDTDEWYTEQLQPAMCTSLCTFIAVITVAVSTHQEMFSLCIN
jgi:hypothetical protein